MTSDKTTTQRKRDGNSAAGTKRVTKKDQLIRMLTCNTGADVGAISAKLGWQAHTTRAALTGLRKAGYEIAAEKAGEGKPAVYRITARPNAIVAGDVAQVREVGHAGQG